MVELSDEDARFYKWWDTQMADPLDNPLYQQWKQEAARKAWDARQGEIDRLMDLHERMQDMYEAELSRLERDNR